MKQENNDRLRTLFHEIKPVKPAWGFDERLISQIHNLNKKRARQAKIISTCWLAGGVAGIFGLVIMIFRTMKWSLDFSGLGIAHLFKGLEMNAPSHFIVSLLFVGLILLIGDTLIFKRSREKRSKEE